ncbi:hypothetical protein BH18ACT7_BH18ACT7_00890 [soil metagenome]
MIEPLARTHTNYSPGVDTLPFVSTVVSICVLALGLMTLVVTQVGHRIEGLDRSLGHQFDAVDQRFDAVDQRFDDVTRRFADALVGLGARFEARFEAMGYRFDAVDARFDGVDVRLETLQRRVGRLETQNETIIGAVTDLGERVTGLERRAS